MKAHVQWQSAVCFKATSETGHELVLDGAPETGGANSGMRPMEAVLIGLGGCSAYDVVTILEKGRAGLTRCEVALSAQRADTIPKVFTQIHLHYIVSGTNLRKAQVARAVELSAHKYCSATAMIEKTTTVTFDHEIVGERVR